MDDKTYLRMVDLLTQIKMHFKLAIEGAEQNRE